MNAKNSRSICRSTDRVIHLERRGIIAGESFPLRVAFVEANLKAGQKQREPPRLLAVHAPVYSRLSGPSRTAGGLGEWGDGRIIEE